MPEFLGPVALNDAYTPSIQIGPAKGVKQFSLSLFAQTSDPTNSYPALVQFWRYPFDPGTGLFNIDGDPTLETGERFFAGNTQGALYTGVAGAKFRNYIAGKKAVCLAEIDFRDDPTGTGGSVSSAVVTTGGTTGGGTAVKTYTWATLPISGTQGDLALVVDTLFGLTGAWLLEYRNDLDATYPWRMWGGNLGPYAFQWSNINTSTGAGSYHNVDTNTVPAAGVWSFAHEDSATPAAAVAGNCKFGVTATSAGTPASFATASPAPVAGDVAIAGESNKQFTLANGASMYLVYNVSTIQLSVGLCGLGARPVKFAGNA